MEERIPVEEMTSPPARLVPWYERPLVLGLLGLALMIGGWKISTFRPASAQRPEVRDLEQKTDDEELRDRLRRFHPTPPYQLPGRLIFTAGLLVFLYAGVRMYGASEREARGEPGA